MKPQAMLASTVLSLFFSAAMSQDVSGKWGTMIETPQGQLPIEIEFNVDGTRLTGTFSNDFIPDIPIQDGLVDGASISFKLTLQVVTLKYTGMITQDNLTLKPEVLEERPSGSRQTLGSVLLSAGELVATRIE